MLPWAHYYINILPYFPKQFSKPDILFSDVFYCKQVFLVWVNTNTINAIPNNEKILHFSCHLFLLFRADFCIQPLYKLQEVFFKKLNRADMQIRGKCSILLYRGFFSFWLHRIWENYVIDKKHFTCARTPKAKGIIQDCTLRFLKNILFVCINKQNSPSCQIFYL